jgi:hypothetical protein
MSFRPFFNRKLGIKERSLPEFLVPWSITLLVVLCGESDTQPVINTGTLYHWRPMADREPFLLPIDEKLWRDLEEWAQEELRSVNGQIEFVLRRAVEERKKGRKQWGCAIDGLDCRAFSRRDLVII